MLRRTNISSIPVTNSDPIIIDQICKLDHSGTQACRVLKAEGFRVVLVNSNLATIITNPGFADAIYIEPVIPEFVERVIAQERPDTFLVILGDQTTLNMTVALHEKGVLERYSCGLISIPSEAIQRGKDWEQFRAIVESLTGIPGGTPEVARSRICHSLEETVATAGELGYPVVVCPPFTTGGVGSGFAHDPEELRQIMGAGLAVSPVTEMLIEESILGRKEYKPEVMGGKADNAVIIYSIEDLDPTGVHTGDSVTVAPAATPTDREYRRMHDVGIAIIRAVGVDTGGCNIQFAINPSDSRMIVTEVNPHVSRNSAFAPKATGFPIAKVAARVAAGYTLDEVPNDIIRVTPASFEPVLDYVVAEAPRFVFEKFPAANSTLTIHMGSVGEMMSIGRNFTGALSKTIRSIEAGTEF